MMDTVSRGSELSNCRIQFVSIITMCLELLLFSGCSDDGCKTNADCPSGKICQRGDCVAAEVDSETESESRGGDGDSDGDADTDTDADADADADSDTDSSALVPDGGMDSDTEQACQAVLQNGESCTNDCECMSGACNRNLCCTTGDCCETVQDCSADLCRVPTCNGNNDCGYGIGPMVCGAEDNDGAETCNDGRVCNGEGGCIDALSSDCGFFAVSGFACGEAHATAQCYTDCTLSNVQSHCVDGARCEAGVCVSGVGLENGEACSSDGQCDSAHCEGGFCCPSGECCGEVSDCSESVCRNRVCNSDHRCVYNFTGFNCGDEDVTDGETCTGDSRCDGAGNCLLLRQCTGPYEWNSSATPTHTCTGNTVEETCYDSCTNINHCSEGYDCVSSTCVSVGLSNGEACNSGDQCASGHCSNGYCCPEGVCCASNDDCRDSLCSEDSICDADNMCYPNALTACGEEDTTGDQTCTGDHRCDGYGNCVVLDTCDGAYAWDTYPHTCSEGSVAETCWTSCLGGFDDPRCNDTYICENNECVPFGLFPNGYSCNTGSECESGYCENNICCTEGECCLDETDCDKAKCVVRFCDGNFNCDYQPIMTCGAADVFDELGNQEGLCDGDRRCDGEGNCEQFDACDGAYASAGSYDCSGKGVTEVCLTSCKEPGDCNDGYTCSGKECIAKIENGGEGCAQNSDCISNYCTTVTGICCDGGWCCNDDGNCDGNPCDTETWSCVFSCLNGDADSDAICAPLGDFHCDNGACYEDLQNGEGGCNEHSDCLSEHCDPETNVCCASGSCCADDEDCNGTLCSADGQCGESCDGNDALCADGYHCEDTSCVADIPDGEGICNKDSDCLSGNCTEETGICCSPGEGDCCNDISQCDDGNPCTTDFCSVLNHCLSSEKGVGERCDDDLFCNGAERCNEQGQCFAEDVPCTDSGSVCVDLTCNEETDSCEKDVGAHTGQQCSESLFCLGGRAKVCTDTGLCVDPEPNGSLPCQEETDNPCTQFVCNEDADVCEETPLANGVQCNDGDACTGDNQCQDGECVRGPELPCDDGNPCTTDPCTDVGGTIVCGDHDAIDDGLPCNSRFACFGETPTCHSGLCIQSDLVCSDKNGICTIHECSEKYYGGVDCGTPVFNTAMAIGCGETLTIDTSKTPVFATREYYVYNDEFCPGEYPGMEAAFAISVPAEGEVTVSVSNVSPAMDIMLLDLADWCTASTCEQAVSSTLTIDTSVGAHVIVLEAMSTLPPDSFEISVSDCP